MIFREHSDLRGKHAPLAPSRVNWPSEDAAIKSLYKSYWAAPLGTATHDLADNLIRKKIKLSKSDKHLLKFELLNRGIPENVISEDYLLSTLVPYVNDAITYNLNPEQVLYISDFAYGTADTIGFDEKTRMLRIHDLKTGEIQADIVQLVRYAAFFCGEYRIDPATITNELRIYQKGEIFGYSATPQEICEVVDYVSYATDTLYSIR